MNKLFLLGSLLCSWSLPLCSQILYQTDFTPVEAGKVPEDFKILTGAFVVKEEQRNKFLELPGAPVEACTVLFGPAESSNVVVGARIQATGKGRRFPTFGVGLNGVAGYRLQLVPAKNALELYKDRELKATAPYSWKSGEWVRFSLQLRGDAKGWAVEGKVWPQSGTEPAQVMVSFEETEAPLPGLPSVFGSPFSGTPLRFDDLRVSRSRRREEAD